MGIDHLEMPLVDRQVDRLAERSAGMVDVGAEIGEPDEVLEVLERSVAAAPVEIVDEGRAVVRREHHRVAADDDVALRIARVLHVARGRGGAELSREAARKAHPLALDVAARAAKEVERARKVAELDADLLEQRVGVALDDFEPFLAENLGQRNVARDVGHGDGRALGAGGAARLAAATRFAGGGRGGFGHGRSLGRGRSFVSGHCDSGVAI